jgi:hypothetical protein
VTNGESAGVRDGEQCALVLMDYQDNTLGNVFEQDRRVIELNVRTLAAVKDVYETYFGELAPLKLTPQYQDPIPLLKASAAGNA